MTADVKVFSFNLILSMDFLLKLSTFLQPSGSVPPSAVEVSLDTKENDARRRKSSVSAAHAHQQQQQQASKIITLTLHIEEYDVILVERMDDINCLALIMNVS